MIFITKNTNFILFWFIFNLWTAESLLLTNWSDLSIELCVAQFSPLTIWCSTVLITWNWENGITQKKSNLFNTFSTSKLLILCCCPNSSDPSYTLCTLFLSHHSSIEKLEALMMHGVLCYITVQWRNVIEQRNSYEAQFSLLYHSSIELNMTAFIKSSPSNTKCNTYLIWNIARGTTDPGYWVYNITHFSTEINLI